MSWQQVTGVLVPGHRVASGQAADSPYPRGTLAMQQPFFAAGGLDLSGYFLGTLNVSIAPQVPELIASEFTFAQVRWSPEHPAETFSFARCQVAVATQRHPAWIYYPHLETKLGHFQAPSTLEVIAPPLGEVAYGSAVTLWLNPETVRIIAQD